MISETIHQITYSVCMALWVNDSAHCSTEPQRHNNQVVQTTPINRAAQRGPKVEEGGGMGWKNGQSARQSMGVTGTGRGGRRLEKTFYFQSVLKTFKRGSSKSHTGRPSGRLRCTAKEGDITRADLAVAEEALRVVVLERLQTIWAPGGKKKNHVRGTVTTQQQQYDTASLWVLVTAYLTVRKHIFSRGNSRGPSTPSSCPSVSKYTSRHTHRREI